MSGLSEILEKQLSGAVEAIKRNMDATDFNATNKTKDSLAFEVTADDATIVGTIFGNASLEWAETGRPPRTNSVDSGLSEKILVWMKARGIGTDLTEKGQRGLARFITLRINALGTKLFQQGRTRDVYSSIIEQLKPEIEKELGMYVNQTIITSFKKTFE